MTLIPGFCLTFLGGVSVGLCMWSIKWARAWKWENYWLVYTLFALILVPSGLALLLLPHLYRVYASLTPAEFWKPMLFGIFWGFAQLGNGICIHRLGFAISNALIIGIGAAFGTLLPLILLHREMLFAPTGLLIVFGTALMITGVALCGWGGYQREEAARRQGRQSGFPPKEAALSHTTGTRGRYVVDLAIGAVSGVLASLLNVALGYGGDIIAKVEAEGGQASWAPFAVWPIALLGGSLVNFAYASYLLSVNHTWSRFISNSFIIGVREVFNPMLAGCLWMGGIALYSSGTTYLGVLGVSIGFALFMSLIVLCGQFAAIITGEWAGCELAIYRPFIFGIALLFLAIGAIGAANYVK